MEHLGDFVKDVMSDVLGSGYDPRPVERVHPDMTGGLIATMLLAAVPPLIEQLNQASGEGRMDLLKSWTGEGSATNIGSFGDQFLYGGRNAGSVFDNIARGVAALSTAPGGASVFGLFFCAEHCPQGRAVQRYTICEEC